MATGTHYSTQRAGDITAPVTLSKPTDRGKLYRSWFDITLVIASNGDAGSIVHLCKLPAGVRVVGGSITVDATFAGAATGDIGITGDTDKYANDIDINTAGTVAFANTAALNCGTITTAEEEVYMTTASAALANGGTAFGWIDYIGP